MASEPVTRHVYALMINDDLSGVATTCVGVLGIEVTPEGVRHLVEYFPHELAKEIGGWPERVDQAAADGSVGPEAIAFWMEAANGVIWDVLDVPDEEFEGEPSLEAAVESVLEGIVTNPVDPHIATDAPAGAMG
jgi:hypothetical protein